MKLRKPCEHGRYEEHKVEWRLLYAVATTPDEICPGGVFLPDDTLVIEKVDGEWPEWFLKLIEPGILAALTDRTELDRNQLGMW